MVIRNYLRICVKFTQHILWREGGVETFLCVSSEAGGEISCSPRKPPFPLNIVLDLLLNNVMLHQKDGVMPMDEQDKDQGKDDLLEMYREHLAVIQRRLSANPGPALDVLTRIAKSYERRIAEHESRLGHDDAPDVTP